MLSPFPYHGADVVALQPAEHAPLNLTFRAVTAPVASVMVTDTFSFHWVPLAGRMELLETLSVPVPTGLPLLSLSVYRTVMPYTQYPKRPYHHCPRVVISQLPESAAGAAAGAVARACRPDGVTGSALMATQARTAPALRSWEPAAVGLQFSPGGTVTG
ncbi:hypothetical protein DEJ51_00445 [Streptomyces venezuelae]|uniref:Uncharacterized protein n=1 Tax=Streptomyces venezuelae TaxID=54571 RepID=A0A5P2DCW4_STRVZ|nr:hypothetical protein DEJ51_00445 [Streptomyces venezuelae]